MEDVHNNITETSKQEVKEIVETVNEKKEVKSAFYIAAPPSSTRKRSNSREVKPLTLRTKSNDTASAESISGASSEKAPKVERSKSLSKNITHARANSFQGMTFHLSSNKDTDENQKLEPGVSPFISILDLAPDARPVEVPVKIDRSSSLDAQKGETKVDSVPKEVPVLTRAKSMELKPVSAVPVHARAFSAIVEKDLPRANKFLIEAYQDLYKGRDKPEAIEPYKLERKITEKKFERKDSISVNITRQKSITSNHEIKDLDSIRNQPSMFAESGNHHIDALAFMKHGSSFLKYGRWGTPHYRFFQISKDNHKLIWYSDAKSPDESQILIATIDEISTGQMAPNFRRYPQPAAQSLSFSIFYNNFTNSVDLIAKSPFEYFVWFNGLTKLIKVPKTTLVYGSVYGYGKIDTLTIEIADKNNMDKSFSLTLTKFASSWDQVVVTETIIEGYKEVQRKLQLCQEWAQMKEVSTSHLHSKVLEIILKVNSDVVLLKQLVETDKLNEQSLKYVFECKADLQACKHVLKTIISARIEM